MLVALPFSIALSSLVILHAGHGQEIAFAEYAYRVLVHVVAIGGIALLVYWIADVITLVRSVLEDDRFRDENDV